MKKVFFAALAILIAGTTMAENKHSIGLTVGSLNGISYKYFFTDKFALQNDLVVGFQATAGGGKYTYKPDGEKATKGGLDLDHTTLSTVEFVYNPNALYHLSLGNMGLNMVLGGGLSIGIGRPYRSDFRDDGNHSVSHGGWAVTNSKTGAPKMGGKFGVNAFAGIEYQMPSAPVVFAFDFRPGYGVMFASERNKDENYKESISLHTFDWRMSFSMRYCF